MGNRCLASGSAYNHRGLWVAMEVARIHPDRSMCTVDVTQGAQRSTKNCTNNYDASHIFKSIATQTVFLSPCRDEQASLPRALVASVLSFSGGASDSDEGGGDLVPLIVQAMARVAS